jgi:hypothetical protein
MITNSNSKQGERERGGEVREKGEEMGFFD